MAASTNCYWNPALRGRFSARKPLPKALNLSTHTAITSVYTGFSKRLCPPIKLIPHPRTYEKFVVTNHLSGDAPEIGSKQPDFLPFPLVSMHGDGSETNLPVKVSGPEPETACDSGDTVSHELNEIGEVYEINESSLFLSRIIFLWVLAYFYLNDKTQFGIHCGSEEVTCEKYGLMKELNGEKDAGHNGGILWSLVSAIPFSTWIGIFSLSYLMSYSKAEIIGIVATGLKNYMFWWRKPKVFSVEWCGQLFMKYYGFIHSSADMIILYLPQIVPKKYRLSFGFAFLFWVASFAVPVLCFILVWRCLCVLWNWVKNNVFKS